MLWLDLVLCRFAPVCRSLAVIPHRLYTKETAVWVVECDKFETFLKCLPSGDPTIHCVFMKNEGGLGKFMQTRFQDLSGKFSDSKAIDFLIFSVYKCRKV